MTYIRIATRKSQLALWQAHWVKDHLQALGHEASLVLIDTLGDQTQLGNQAFAQLSGQGFFTKAVQNALLNYEADVAVHSFKDLPSAPVAALELAAVTERADAREVLLIRPEFFDASAQNLPLKEACRVGTSAVRRQKQLAYLRPDLVLRELRGNVPTRVDKLRQGQYDAIVLAAAGLERLQLELTDLSQVVLDPDVMMPAPAQGCLALECRRTDFELASVLTNLHDVPSYKAVAAERGLMAMFQGGCQLALGAYAQLKNGQVQLKAWYEGQIIEVVHPSSEGAAMLAFEALGRPLIKESL